MMSVYLDANASEPVRANPLKAAMDAARDGGNPSSIHKAGRKAYGLLEGARKDIAGLCGFETDGCVFTSGATEANALALHRLDHTGKPYILHCIGSTEHASLWNFIQSPKSISPDAKVLTINVDKNGRYDFPALKKHIALKREEFNEQETNRTFSALVCISVANSETGILTNIDEALELCKEMQIDLHIDATQAIGRGWIPSAELSEYASFALSGHKMGGLQGAGALLLPQGTRITPVIPGRGQELGRRKGTQPLPAIVSMAEALKESRAQDWDKICKLRDELQLKLENSGAFIVGRDVKRLPNTIYAALKGISSQVQLMKLDMMGFDVSAGSACSSGKTESSHVLEAMGYEDIAGSTIRISLPWNVTEQAVRSFAEAYKEMAQRLKEQ